MSKHQTRPKKQELVEAGYRELGEVKGMLGPEGKIVFVTGDEIFEIPFSEYRRPVTGHRLKGTRQEIEGRIAAARRRKYLESLGLKKLEEQVHNLLAPDKEKEIPPVYQELQKIEKYINEQFAYIDSQNIDGRRKRFRKGMVSHSVAIMVSNMDYKKLPLEVLDQLFSRFDITFIEAMRRLEADFSWQE